MKVAEGGCLCGAVRYRVGGDPVTSIVCHCTTCRRASAAPSVGWVMFEVAHYEQFSGELRVFASSPSVRRSFCATCGTPLTYVHAESPSTIDVTTLSLDDPSLFPPTREVWLSDKVSWAATDAALGHYPRDSAGGPYPTPPDTARDDPA